ncbi:MAG: DUF4236 domain-containing protein [Balneolales bacterium]|nr:DUF4236 domain-containing protein [Balneolales bacterium]
MPFFIRKSVSFGPLRVNLSKGGVGLSAGVTGARVGLNRHGTYVAGGRHGFYYRDKIGSKNRSGRSTAGAQSTKYDNNEHVFFTDTGATFSDNSKATPPTDFASLFYPARKNYTWPVALLTAVIVIAMTYTDSVLLFLASFSVYPLTKRFLTSLYDKDEKEYEEITKKLEQQEPETTDSSFYKEITSLPVSRRFRKIRDLNIASHLLRHLVHLITQSKNDIQNYALRESYMILNELNLPEDAMNQLKIEALDDLLQRFLSDHIISEEEEQILFRVMRSVELEARLVQEQTAQIRQLSEMRKVLNGHSIEMDVPLQLTNNEKPVYSTPARLLKEKMQRRFQRQGIVYKEYGYDINGEGIVYLTTENIYFKQENEKTGKRKGVQSWKIAHVTDILCSLEDLTVHISIRNRVNPIIFTVKEPAVFSAKLHYFLGG